LINDLCDLRKLFLSNKVKIKEFTGAYLKTESGDNWGMSLGVLYKNNEPVNQKELVDSFSPKKKKRGKKK